MCNNGITQFYLPPTHEPYLPLLPRRKASPPFGWYTYSAYPRRDGQAELICVAGTHGDKCLASGIEPVHGHPSQY